MRIWNIWWFLDVCLHPLRAWGWIYNGNTTQFKGETIEFLKSRSWHTFCERHVYVEIVCSFVELAYTAGIICTVTKLCLLDSISSNGQQAAPSKLVLKGVTWYDSSIFNDDIILLEAWNYTVYVRRITSRRALVPEISTVYAMPEISTVYVTGIMTCSHRRSRRTSGENKTVYWMVRMTCTDSAFSTKILRRNSFTFVICIRAGLCWIIRIFSVCFLKVFPLLLSICMSIISVVTHSSAAPGNPESTT